jgi:hypothetical protein
MPTNGGVKIQVILDRSNRTANYSSADFVAHAGIPTFIDDKHAIAHNKIMVIDGHSPPHSAPFYESHPRSNGWTRG